MSQNAAPSAGGGAGAKAGGGGGGGGGGNGGGSKALRPFQTHDKPTEVRLSNLMAAKAVADAVRTSLGPRGMDKMIQTKDGEIVITNDGATILKHMSVMHPAAQMLVDLSSAQDVEAGDGTTSVVVIAGSLLAASEKLLEKGMHPSQIHAAFNRAAEKSVGFLEEMAMPLGDVGSHTAGASSEENAQKDLTSEKSKESLVRAAATSLGSKIVAQYSSLLAPLAVSAVLRVLPSPSAPSATPLPSATTPHLSHIRSSASKDSQLSVDLRDIRIIKKVGGTIEDTELLDGLGLHQNAITSHGGPSRVQKAKIGLIQFQISSPKPDMDNQIVVNDYRLMDRVIKEAKVYLLGICKTIYKSGCNVLLIQKSILRDAVDEMALEFLSKLKIAVVKDVERDEIDFICKTLGCKPIADIESFSSDKLAEADLFEETPTKGGGSKVTRITGIKNGGKTCSILCTGANSLVLEESERSLHDALCVVRCLVKKRALVAGGGSPEIHLSRLLSQHANTLKGIEAYCFQAYAEALEVIPTTLAENAGLNPIAIVTELRNRHARGERTAGVNVRKGTISNILEENVVQPLLVSTSMIELATETVGLLLKIDDYCPTR